MEQKIDFAKLRKMFFIFFRIGAFTIGGGYAMLPLIEKEITDQGWANHEEIIDIFAVSQSIPGVIAINSSMFIGYKVAGIPGICAAALGVILPSFLIILGIAYFLINFKNNIYIAKAFTGVRAGVTGLIALSAITLGKSAIKNNLGLWIAVVAFICVAFLEIHAIWVIIAGGFIGLTTQFWYKGKRK